MTAPAGCDVIACSAREAVMIEEINLGAAGRCTDGSCGVVARTILDPGAGTITHLVIEPRHRKDTGRLVPVDLVDVNGGEVTLRCTLASSTTSFLPTKSMSTTRPWRFPATLPAA